MNKAFSYSRVTSSERQHFNHKQSHVIARRLGQATKVNVIQKHLPREDACYPFQQYVIRAQCLFFFRKCFPVWLLLMEHCMLSLLCVRILVVYSVFSEMHLRKGYKRWRLKCHYLKCIYKKDTNDALVHCDTSKLWVQIVPSPIQHTCMYQTNPCKYINILYEVTDEIKVQHQFKFWTWQKKYI